MKNIRLLLTVLVFAFSSCTEEILNEIDTNPNQINNAPLKTILPQVQVSYVTEIAGGGTAINTFYLAELNTFVLGNNALQAVQGMGEQAWTQGYLALNDLAILKQKAIESNAPTYAGIADVLRAFNLAALTDWFGDIPYSEALRSDIVNPSFDKADTIYPEIQKILDEAIVNLEKESGPLAPRADDLIFNGNKSLWIKTAYGLKARLHNRLSNLDPTGSANNALSAISKSFSSDAEGFVFNKFNDLNTNGNSFSVSQNNQPQSAVGNGIYNAMAGFTPSGKIEGDPRASIWFTKVKGQIIPAPNGTARPDFGEPRLDGAFYSKPEIFKHFRAPVPLLTYTELKFIEAEANLRLNNPTKAYEAYQTATSLALNHAGDFNPAVKLSPAQINTYLQSDKVLPGANKLTQHDVIMQKYIYFYQYQPLEAYNDVRRTGFVPVTDPTGRPNRIPYPVSEVTRNLNTPKDIDNISTFEPRTKVFWAKK
jgi:hypothetical protein